MNYYHLLKRSKPDLYPLLRRTQREYQLPRVPAGYANGKALQRQVFHLVRQSRRANGFFDLSTWLP